MSLCCFSFLLSDNFVGLILRLLFLHLSNSMIKAKIQNVKSFQYFITAMKRALQNINPADLFDPSTLYEGMENVDEFYKHVQYLVCLICLEPRSALLQGQTMCQNCYNKNIPQHHNIGDHYTTQGLPPPREIPTCWIIILGRDSKGLERLLSYYTEIKEWLSQRTE